MTAQSWVETTLPPGYTLIDSWAGRGCVWQTNERQGWCMTKAETCRAAWRHWTAAVLRGREMRWSYHDRDREAVEHEFVPSTVENYYTSALLGRTERQCQVEAWQPFDERGFFYIASSVGSRGMGEFGGLIDPDEAMARFAALVLATEGPR